VGGCKSTTVLHAAGEHVNVSEDPALKPLISTRASVVAA
jgi:hypothetical protein